MALSRTRTAMVVYWLGVALPVLMEVALRLAERAGAKPSIGVAWIALASFAVSVLGVVIARATLKRTLALLACAVVIIPIEYLVLGVFFLTRSGLSGTQ